MISVIKDISDAGTSATSSDSNSIRFSVKPQQPSQTMRGGDKARFISLSDDTEFMQNAFSVISRVKDVKVAKTGAFILGEIENLISRLKNEIPDSHNIPKLRGAITEEGAFLIEWATEKFRAGISIEPDERDSGWYLVTTRDLEDINNSGSFTQKNEDSIIEKLLYYVIQNT